MNNVNKTTLYLRDQNIDSIIYEETNLTGGGRCYNLKNGKEGSEVTEGKSSRMR